ncbi:MAG: DUF4325 domain-containing protein [bacterium]|nr:DUF4325 domain-containing protein [bacterium]
MSIKEFILKHLEVKKEVKVADIVKATGFSRAYINRFFQELKDEGRIILISRANKARYVMATRKEAEKARRSILSVNFILKNENLNEDAVLGRIKRESGVFFDLSENVSAILNYAFTEMLNNAIEHSRSDGIRVGMEKSGGLIRFEVRDKGVGIFNNIMKKRKLKNKMEAIQDLLKGKQTTAPRKHTGEGIFFTSKVADRLVIQSSEKKLIFDNVAADIFITDVKNTVGTKVAFIIAADSRTDLNAVFKKYTGPAFSFGKTEVSVRLYKMDVEFISRSQARRILSGLEKFKIIVLDFKGVKTVGQAFADEVFRVWHNNHPGIKIEYRNADENADFMIKRAIKVKAL